MPEPTTQETLQLKTFIIQQQQAISTAHNQFKIGSVAYYAKKSIYVIIEVLMYILFVVALISVFAVPLDPISGTKAIDEHSSISGTYHNDNLTGLMILVRVAVFIGSLAFLFLGLVFRSLRKKHTLLMSAYKTIDELKKSFDAFTAKWSAGG